MSERTFEKQKQILKQICSETDYQKHKRLLSSHNHYNHKKTNHMRW